MTSLSYQQRAIAAAVRVAVAQIGLNFIQRTEFFGTNQTKRLSSTKAA